jgi:hypothetical protein
MSDSVEHKTYKQALLEFYQAKGTPSSEIKLEVEVKGSPHCPNFLCTVKLPRVPSTQFAGQVICFSIFFPDQNYSVYVSS